MTFELLREGVWSQVQSFLNNRVERYSHIYWVTFTIDPPIPLLELFLARDLRVTIIGRHPCEALGSSSFFHRASWDRIFKEKCGSVDTVYGLRDERHADGEDDGWGPLHAKFIVSRSPDSSRNEMMSGSFNLARNSFDANCEHIAVGTRDEAIDAWCQAERLLNAAYRIERSECNHGGSTDGLGVGRMSRRALAGLFGGVV